ncbi:hypothetical protein ACLOJK_014999, partial [Asimina triloba]
KSGQLWSGAKKKTHPFDRHHHRPKSGRLSQAAGVLKFIRSSSLPNRAAVPPSISDPDSSACNPDSSEQAPPNHQASIRPYHQQDTTSSTTSQRSTGTGLNQQQLWNLDLAHPAQAMTAANHKL